MGLFRETREFFSKKESKQASALFAGVMAALVGQYFAFGSNHAGAPTPKPQFAKPITFYSSNPQGEQDCYMIVDVDHDVKGHDGLLKLGTNGSDLGTLILSQKSRLKPDALAANFAESLGDGFNYDPDQVERTSQSTIFYAKDDYSAGLKFQSSLSGETPTHSNHH